MRSKAFISAAVITISLALGLRAEGSITKAIAADLKLLDQELARSTIYDTNKERRLDSLKLVAQRTPDAEAHYRLCSRIGSEYMTFVADSATAYYYKALADAKRLQSHELKVKALIGITNSLAVSGFFSSAQIAIDTLADDVPPSLQIEYYNAARQLYYYMTDYAAGNEQHLRIFAERYHYYRDALIRLLPPESNICKYYRAEQLEDLGHYSAAAGILRNLLDQSPSDDDGIAARIYSRLAGIALKEGNIELRAHYLVKSAIADLRASVKENTSIQALAVFLFGEDDLEHAYAYTRHALDDANFCNARLRFVQIARNMPIINNTFNDHIQSQRHKIIIALLFVSALALMMVVLIIRSARQNLRLRLTEQKLRDANSLKETYLGSFLELCAIYMDRLDAFNKTVKRKVSTGQIDDLLKMTKTSKFSDDQNREFYDKFDSAFLHIYPTFVEQFNALLAPEHRITTPRADALTAELRIFALLRMGFDDSTKIASFLQYSVNTIYAYRNKIRGYALNRDTFDADVMKISSAM